MNQDALKYADEIQLFGADLDYEDIYDMIVDAFCAGYNNGLIKNYYYGTPRIAVDTTNILC